MTTLQGKTLFVTGASRGIGLAIAKRAAADGANVVLVAKTTEPNPKLPGTLYSAAEEVEAAGGQALPVPTDIRDEDAVAAAVRAAVERFGGIDILVNNASAISLTGTAATPMKRFDLMFGVNVRGTYCCTQACLPHLIESGKAGRNPHVLNMAPPLSMKPHWFAHHTAYTMAKYGMSMCTLGHAAEFARHGIGVNSLWPRTAIATAALQMIPHAARAARRDRPRPLQRRAGHDRLHPGLLRRLTPTAARAAGGHFDNAFSASLMPSATPTSAGSAFSAALASRSW